MPTTYDQFRVVLRKLGFEQIRSRKHEIWIKKLDDGTIRRVRVSHQHGRDIPTWLFHKMLKQAGIDRETFQRILAQ